MKRIAEFQKVSREQFIKDWKDSFEGVSDEQAGAVYDSIKLPKRATSGYQSKDRRRMDARLLSEKRTWLQIPHAAQQYSRDHRQ